MIAQKCWKALNKILTEISEDSGNVGTKFDCISALIFVYQNVTSFFGQGQYRFAETCLPTFSWKGFCVCACNLGFEPNSLCPINVKSTATAAVSAFTQDKVTSSSFRRFSAKCN